MLSYFFVFAQWPLTRDIPWVNYIILLLALGLTGYGVANVWAKGLGSKIASITSLFFSAAFPVLFIGYVFGLSNQLPSAEQAVSTGNALPDLVLTGDDGEPINVADVAQDKLILVFFRGHW